MPGFTLVVAPITALVRKGAASSGSWLPGGSGVFLDAETPVADRNLILKRIREHDQNLLLVHVTPAMLVESGPFRSALADARICRVVLDEFHTIEEWGFYAAMNDVCDAITRLPGRPPFTLLTATTSTRVTAELLRRLDAGAVLVEQPMVRPHVHLGVTVLGGSGSSTQLCLAMARWIKFHHPDTSDLGVVFTPTPADCGHLVRGLAKLGIMALVYHGDMPRREDKECALRVWETGKIQVALKKQKAHTHIPTPFKASITYFSFFLLLFFQVMVSTVAFGMGVDDPRIKFVLHDGVPASISEWIQKSGRGGRLKEQRAQSMSFVSPFRVARAFRVYGETSAGVARFCDAISASLNCCECRQHRLNLWPVDVTGSPTCQERCDNCLRRTSQPTLGIVVNTAAAEVIEVVRALERKGARCSFSVIESEWHLTCEDAIGEAVPVLLLLIISFGYLLHLKDSNQFAVAPEQMLQALEQLHGNNATWLVPLPERPGRKQAESAAWRKDMAERGEGSGGGGQSPCY